MANTARDRAEELLHNLQTRTRDWLEAEEGVVHTVREALDDRIMTPAELRKRLEELLGKIKANKVWERIRTSDQIMALSDYRDEFERRVEEIAQRVIETLPVASKSDVASLKKQIKSLNRKVNDLNRKLKEIETTAA